jgi:WD40 repeat protein
MSGNIVKYTFDNELIGSRFLGTREHRHLKPVSFPDRLLQNTRSIVTSDHFTSKLPRILREHEFNLVDSQVNKIFCAQWLDERRCLMGTKCNKLILIDTQTGKYSVQSALKSHPSSRNIPNHCGIHAISVNPSRTRLATGAEHVNDVAVYSLPDLEPQMVGFDAHSYWIFDMIWIDDEHLVSGAGDNRLAMWSMGEDGGDSEDRVLTRGVQQHKLAQKSSPSKLNFQEF